MKKLFFLLWTVALLLPALAHSQDRQVQGQVIDDSTGQGIPLASVTVSGTDHGVNTDAAGRFSLSVQSAAATKQLVISSIGYTTKRVAMGADLVIRLQKENKTLEDVVVIGYGTQKKRNVTGAVSSFDARKLEERPVARVDQALVGQLAGVTVKQTTGIPGKGFSVQVRGTGSITGGNEPLYVIDGFPLAQNSSNAASGSYSTGNPLDNINPNDIENIEVLKDAAAAAIYGSRASNGVVLITTRRGRTGRANINFNVYGGYNEAAKKLQMLNGDQWIDRATEMINAAYVLKYGSVGAAAADNDAVRRTKIGLTGTQISTSYMLDPRWSMTGHPGLAYHDWQDVIERKGATQNYQLSASGGNENVRYFVSGNYARQQGFIIGVDYTSYSLRANVEANLSKKIKLGVNIAPTYSVTKDPGVEGKDNIFHQALSMTPVQEDSVGDLPNIGKNAQYAWSNTTNGLLGKLLYNVGTTKRFRTLGTIYGEFEIVKGLNWRSAVNLDNTDNASNGYVPYITTGTQASRTFNGSNNLLAGTSGSYSSYKRMTFVTEHTLTYTHLFNNIHDLTILGGYAYNTDRFDRTQLNSSGGYTNSSIQTLNAAANVTGNTTSTQNVFISYFGRVQYSLHDKYLFLASLRRDGSSRFGINNQFALFPAASIGWRVIEENFMKQQKIFNDLKLRVSYGENGNNLLPGDYTAATLGSYGYSLGATQGAVIGQAPNVLANQSLQWEKSRTWDAGIDFGLLNNRITGSFDYYNKFNTNLLLNVQVPEATGFQTYLSNVGAVRNIGEELELTTRNTTGKFQWTTTINVSHNSNKVESLAPGQNQIIIPNSFEVSDQILRVGQPLNSIYVVKQIGFLTQDDITKKVALYGSGETVGDPKYMDFNGDGVITEADKQIVGHPNPNYTYGITNTFRYKGFDLSVLVQGQSGGSIYSLLGRAITRTGQGFTDNAPVSYTERWRSPDNQGAGRFSKAYSTFGFVANTDWLYSSDYIRVRNITLGYNLKSIVKTRALQGARLYLTLENFFGHDKYYNGLNPEAANTTVSSNSAYPEAGDYGGLPLAKSLIVGLNISL